MELSIKPHSKNLYPIGGILVKSPSPSFWIQEIQAMQLSLKEIEVYPIPDVTPNSVWGCFIIPQGKIDVHAIGQHEVCQRVMPSLYIAEKSVLFPSLSPAEMGKLFAKGICLVHPEFGWVECSTGFSLCENAQTPTIGEQVDWKALIIPPMKRDTLVTQPESGVFIPKEVRRFQVKPVPPEEVLKDLEEKIFPKTEKMQDEPLNIVEKGKLSFYKSLFYKNELPGKDKATEKTELGKTIDSFFEKIFKQDGSWSDNMQEDYEDLEKRNQREIDKLMEMLKNNPEEALKYAIPLDGDGTGRGGGHASFNMDKRWFDFSLFGGGGGGSRGGSGSMTSNEYFFQLQAQYNTTAEALIAKKDYMKAAFVYMKLLKNYHKAAETLENGKLYQEAATIYLKHANNKPKAAECYEKGNMIEDAIGIYKELNENEKVGDLYVGIQKRKEANMHYEKVVEAYTSKDQYVKGSLIYKNKMLNQLEGQKLLLEGWQKQKDGVNCLCHYFDDVEDVKQLKQEINRVYTKEVGAENREAFLQVVRHEFQKNNELSDDLKEMAYEIIAAQININPKIVSELKTFNVNDKELPKDMVRFKVNRKG